MKLKEAKKSKGGTTDHAMWRNYDDLNEYFWLELNLIFYLFPYIYDNIAAFDPNLSPTELES